MVHLPSGHFGNGGAPARGVQSRPHNPCRRPVAMSPHSAAMARCRSQIVGKTSAQLQNALTLSLTALRKPNPPFVRDNLALSNISGMPRISSNCRRQFHTEESCTQIVRPSSAATRMCSQPTRNAPARFQICVFPWLIRIRAWSHEAVSTDLCNHPRKQTILTWQQTPGDCLEGFMLTQREQNYSPFALHDWTSPISSSQM